MCPAFFVLVLLLFTSNQQGVLLSDNWHNYPYTPDGSLISFPVDEGVHTDPTVIMEWWYLNFTLVGGPPDHNLYTGMVCYFRPIPLRILNIGNATTGEFYDNAIPALGDYTFSDGHLELTYDFTILGIHDYWRWTYPNDSITFSYILNATNPSQGNALKLTLTSNKSPLIVGGDGWVGIGGEGDSSYYYSLTNLRVTGSIDCGSVHDTIISGIAWLDRQWGPFFVDPESDYEWFSIQVDSIGAILGEPTPNSAEFNIWQIYTDTNHVPFNPTGRMLNIRFGDDFSDTTSQFIFERLDYWKDPSGERYFSHGWRFIDTIHSTCLELTPMIENQMVSVGFMRYWEGGCLCIGTVNGISVEGTAFAELPRRVDYMITPPGQPSDLSAVSKLSSITIYWRPAISGTYPIGGYRVYRACEDMAYPEFIGSTTDTSYTDVEPPAGVYWYWVSSFDNQTATSASERAGPVEAEGIEEKSKSLKVQKSKSLKVYPNPFTTVINVKWLGISENEKISLKIYDLSGRLVRTLTTNPYPLTPDLNAGIYFLKTKGYKPVKVVKLK